MSFPLSHVALPSERSTPAFIEPTSVVIPEGWFQMGCEAGQDNEKPLHRVWVDAFELAICQTTNAEYERFLVATNRDGPLHWSDPAFSHPQQPVVAVSWFDAVAYSEWLSRLSGRRYRLPTEAEWERAARGNLESALYPWGDAPPESLPHYASRWRTGPELVGQDAPSSFGLHDVGANVHEWCSDWYAPDYYQHSPTRNPCGPAEGKRRASRGGSWRHYIKISRCAARSSIPPEFHYADYGFRLARDLS